MHMAMLPAMLALCLVTTTSALHVGVPLARAPEESSLSGLYPESPPETLCPPGTTACLTLSTTATSMVSTTTVTSTVPPTVTSTVPQITPPFVTIVSTTPPPVVTPSAPSIYATPGADSTVTTTTATDTVFTSSTTLVSSHGTFSTSCTHWPIPQLPPPSVTDTTWTPGPTVHSTSCSTFQLTTNTLGVPGTPATNPPPGTSTPVTGTTPTILTTTALTTPTTAPAASTPSGVNYSGDQGTSTSTTVDATATNNTATFTGAAARHTAMSTLVALAVCGGLQAVLL